MPAGYRTAWRLLRTAQRLRLPVLTLIDTAGASMSPEAEAAGQAHAISETFARMLALRVPTVALVIGEGGSGGALALAVADRLLLQTGSVFSVIAPEGAAAILHRDRSRAPEVANRLKLTAEDVVGLGIAHGMAPEDPAEALSLVSAHLDELMQLETERLAELRTAHWAGLGA